MEVFLIWQKTKHWQIFTAILAMSVLSIYVYILLRLTDKVLFHVIVGYQSTSSYGFGVGIFFMASSLYLYLIRKQSWNRTFPFFSTAIALFFPLVVFSSMLRINIGLPEAVNHFYANNLCIRATTESLCGQALAHIVFCMTVRALPLVLTVPLLYRLMFSRLYLKPTESSADGK
jgi:hypothetical protein